jgi:hypothetical protein
VATAHAHRITSENTKRTTSTTFSLSSGGEEFACVRPCFWLFLVDVVSDIAFLPLGDPNGAKHNRWLVVKR